MNARSKNAPHLALVASNSSASNAAKTYTRKAPDRSTNYNHRETHQNSLDPIARQRVQAPINPLIIHKVAAGRTRQTLFLNSSSTRTKLLL